MSLRIEIFKYRGHAISSPSSVIFGKEGGTVGRSNDNRLVLPDECISRKHARIIYENGRYFLVDSSSNGTQIVNRDVYVQGDTAELMDGDILRIGDYELSVRIEASDSSPAATGDIPGPAPGYGPPDLADGRAIGPPPGQMRSSPPQREPAIPAKKQITIDDFFADSDEEQKGFSASPQEEPEFDIPELTPPPEAPPVQKPAPARKSASVPESAPIAEQNQIRQPNEVQAPEQVPEPVQARTAPPSQKIAPAEHAPSSQAPAGAILDTAQMEPLDSRPLPAPPVRREQAPENLVPEVPSEPTGLIPEEAYRELFRHFLKGARLEDPALLNSPELPKMMEEIGSVFRELAQGLWTVLKGRMELKAEFRLAMTMVRPSNNNPLKLSPTVEDAVKHLLKRLHPSFMEPAAAVREGYEDVMNHQIAMNAGIQASLAEAFERFNPERISGKTKEGIFGKKSKNWEIYCDSFGELKDQALDGIFGKAFIRAYEQQLEKLRTKKSDG
ncbi:MAG: type VI secretion system-associated FHA domain protein TagH [Syntrophobacter sp.]